jgi:hypothetical protein
VKRIFAIVSGPTRTCASARATAESAPGPASRSSNRLAGSAAGGVHVTISAPVCAASASAGSNALRRRRIPIRDAADRAESGAPRSRARRASRPARAARTARRGTSPPAPAPRGRSRARTGSRSADRPRADARPGPARRGAFGRAYARRSAAATRRPDRVRPGTSDRPRERPTTQARPSRGKGLGASTWWGCSAQDPRPCARSSAQ